MKLAIVHIASSKASNSATLTKESNCQEPYIVQYFHKGVYKWTKEFKESGANDLTTLLQDINKLKECWTTKSGPMIFFYFFEGEKAKGTINP